MRRPPRRAAVTTTSRIFLGLYAIVVLTIVFWPLPVDRPVAGEINLAVDFARQAGATAITYDRIEIISNVLLFVPLGALGVLALDRVRWWLIPLGCLAISVLVELAQLVFLSARSASIVDVAANLAGALLGAALAQRARRPAR